MSRYDLGVKYNVLGFNGGFTYDYRTPSFSVYVTDGFSSSDTIALKLASLYFNERFMTSDFSDVNAMQSESDKFYTEESSNIISLMNILERFNALETFLTVVAACEQDDEHNMEDDILNFANNIVNDVFFSKDDCTLDVLAEYADYHGMQDLSDIFTVLAESHDRFYTNDGNPRTTDLDWYIGSVNGLDNRKKWLYPFNLALSKGHSSFQVMPTSESTYIDIPGVDGSIVTDTVYNNRVFNIVAFSVQGMDTHQKEQFKNEIVNLLDETKHKTKRLSFQETGITFDVKYSGDSQIDEGNSWIRAQFSLESSPYGETTFPDEVFGDGIIVNDGNIPVGPVVEISEGCVNPNFFIGDDEFFWNGTVPDGNTLVIDNENKTCYLKNTIGLNVQALDKLTKGYRFHNVNQRDSETIRCLNESTVSRIKTTYRTKHIWSGGA